MEFKISSAKQLQRAKDWRDSWLNTTGFQSKNIYDPFRALMGVR